MDRMSQERPSRPREPFGEWLTRAMRSAGIRNQSELAELVDVTPSAVNTWVKNRRMPDISMAASLARALGVPRLAVYQAMGKLPRLEGELAMQLADVLETVDDERANLVVQIIAAAQALPEDVLRTKLDELRILAEHYRRQEKREQVPSE